MADYKKMYLKLFHASEQAIALLIEAQQECEDIFISETEPLLQMEKPALRTKNVE